MRTLRGSAFAPWAEGEETVPALCLHLLIIGWARKHGKSMNACVFECRTSMRGSWEQHCGAHRGRGLAGAGRAGRSRGGLGAAHSQAGRGPGVGSHHICACAARRARHGAVRGRTGGGQACACACIPARAPSRVNGPRQRIGRQHTADASADGVRGRFCKRRSGRWHAALHVLAARAHPCVVGEEG